MDQKRQVQIAFILAIVLLLCGIICYAAFPKEAPEHPYRVFFKGVGGYVLFNHQEHSADYDLNCRDCHHHPSKEQGDLDTQACGTCHTPSDSGDKLSKSCLDCHDEEDIEGTEVPHKADAFHKQCIGCHKENDAGPTECKDCHAK